MPLTDTKFRWYFKLSLWFHLPAVGVQDAGCSQTLSSPAYTRLLIRSSNCLWWCWCLQSHIRTHTHTNLSINMQVQSQSHVRKPPGDMGWTVKALIRPECKHPHRIAVQWKEWAVRNLLSLCLSVSVCLCLHLCVCVWFCSDNTLGYRYSLRKGYLASRDWWHQIAVTLCTSHMLYNGKVKKCLLLSFLHLLLHTGKGGRRSGVSRGHSLWLPEGPGGECVSWPRAHSRSRTHC